MFFVLSKVLYFLLVPFWWIVILLVWMWRARSPRLKRILLIISLVLAVVFTNPFIYRALVLKWQSRPVTLPPGKKYDAGIVLGGMAGYDRYERGHFGSSADRFIQTANLYHQGFIRRVIITGGTGNLRQNEPAESFFLRKQFLENGIPDSCIIIEYRSRNTYENAVYTKRLIDSLHLSPPFVLITSAIHMKRSEAVFRRAGVSFVPFPCDFKVNEVRPELENYIVPDVSLLDEWSYFFKEIIGLFVYRITGKA